MLATLVAFYLPSSVAGEILRSLSIVSLLLTCGLLGALAVQRHGLWHPAIVITSLGMLALLLFFTMVSPFPELSPGVVFIYTAIAIMFALNLREIAAPRAGSPRTLMHTATAPAAHQGMHLPCHHRVGRVRAEAAARTLGVPLSDDQPGSRGLASAGPARQAGWPHGHTDEQAFLQSVEQSPRRL